MLSRLREETRLSQALPGLLPLKTGKTGTVSATHSMEFPERSYFKTF